MQGADETWETLPGWRTCLGLTVKWPDGAVGPIVFLAIHAGGTREIGYGDPPVTFTIDTGAEITALPGQRT